MIKHILFSGTAALALLAASAMADAQSIDTRIGKLELHNGYPSKATVEKLYDEMDFQRATQAFIWALPAVGFHGLPMGTPDPYTPRKCPFRRLVGSGVRA